MRHAATPPSAGSPPTPTAHVPLPTPAEHVARLVTALEGIGPSLGQVESWGIDLAEVLRLGGRLLACGNGGSAADAQHLTAEFVGRYRDDRQPFSAIALSAETSSLTAIGNDYGYEEVFARQVRAHGRRGDVLIAISTSGTSANVCAAARAARQCGVTVWALTGPAGSELHGMSDDAIAVPAEATATVQEIHGVLIHALCATVDRVLSGDLPAIYPMDGGGNGDGGDRSDGDGCAHHGALQRWRTREVRP